MNERYHAFIGRVNRDEYVTERDLSSGAFPNQIGRVEDDETLFGIAYRSPKEGPHFDADAGVRLRFPVDPFVKGAFVLQKGEASRVLFGLRETAFWQNSEGAGFTTRFDVERVIDLQWMVRGTLSAVLALPLLCVGFAHKILSEERLLSDELGDEYRQYRQKTAALIPYLL